MTTEYYYYYSPSTIIDIVITILNVLSFLSWSIITYHYLNRILNFSRYIIERASYATAAANANAPRTTTLASSSGRLMGTILR